MAAAVTAVSARDSSGVGLRLGMVMMTAGAAFLLPWRFAIPAALAIWLVPNYMRSVLDNGEPLFSTNMLLELPGLLGVAIFCAAIHHGVRKLEEAALLSGSAEEAVDPQTGVYDEKGFRLAIESELTRSRRFERPFALVLVGIDEKHQRFAFRDEAEWNASFNATAQLLLKTRARIDRVYRHGTNGFALLLPESSDKEVTGLVRRLRKLATNTKPREGLPGGPLPVAFGATFFPTCASNVEDLLRRADIALRIASKNSNRLQIDGAEAPAMAAPETLRQPDLEEFSATETSQHVSDAWVAEPVQKHEAPPVVLTLVPTDELVTTVLKESGEAVEEPMPAPVEEKPQFADQPIAEPRMTDEELTQLLGRLDETLGLIRGLKSQAS